MKTIAIIDDDVYIGNMLEELLAKEGYHVIRAYSGTEALLRLSSQKPDLVLLDLMLPGLSGEEVLPKITGVPVIVVSAKVDVSDKVKLLVSGAADYITKPFDTSELLARIAVQLRGPASAGLASTLSFGNLVLDSSTRSVTAGGVPVRLTKTEYAILKPLLQNPTQVVPKSRLLDLISEETLDCTESSLKVHIGNLRKKLREASGEEYIDAVWGIGYTGLWASGAHSGRVLPVRQKAYGQRNYNGPPPHGRHCGDALHLPGYDGGGKHQAAI